MTRFLITLLSVAAFPACAWALSLETPVSPTPQTPFEVSYNDAEQAIGAALTGKGAGDKVLAIIAGHKNGALYASDKPINVEVKGLTFDKQASRWSASLLFVADNEVVTAMPASGRFEEILTIPVLKRQVRSGDLITEADIETHDFPLVRTRNDTVTDIAELVGKTPVRTISPARPIRKQEIATPAVVKKNAMVEMHYNSPGIEISMSGQAMDEGAKGDVISVRNTASKRIVRAMVEDSNTVSILPPNAQTSQLTGGLHATN